MGMTNNLEFVEAIQGFNSIPLSLYCIRIPLQLCIANQGQLIFLGLPFQPICSKMGTIGAITLNTALYGQKFVLGLVICLGGCNMKGASILCLKFGNHICNTCILGVNIHLH